MPTKVERWTKVWVGIGLKFEYNLNFFAWENRQDFGGKRVDIFKVVPVFPNNKKILIYEGRIVGLIGGKFL